MCYFITAKQLLPNKKQIIWFASILVKSGICKIDKSDICVCLLFVNLIVFWHAQRMPSTCSMHLISLKIWTKQLLYKRKTHGLFKESKILISIWQTNIIHWGVLRSVRLLATIILSKEFLELDLKTGLLKYQVSYQVSDRFQCTNNIALHFSC